MLVNLPNITILLNLTFRSHFSVSAAYHKEIKWGELESVDSHHEIQGCVNHTCTVNPSNVTNELYNSVADQL